MKWKACKQQYFPVTGRVFIALIFLMAGINKIMDFTGTAEMMGGKGFPLPELFLVGAIVFLLAGSIGIILGYFAKWAAWLLIIFLIPTTLIFHPPWVGEQLTAALKNLALLGGLMYVIVHGSGPFSLR